MKIAIIGGGWLGCHLAYKLHYSHDVTLYEKNKTLFKETSYNNQNRLHMGFHYPRSYETRKMSNDTFSMFLNDYKFLTNDLNKNIYCISKNDSLVDYDTYLEIFKNFKKDLYQNDKIKNVEGCLVVNEKYIDFDSANKFFNKTLESIFCVKDVKIKNLIEFSKKYDLVINTTNNFLNYPKINDSFYELTITFLYKKIKNLDFDAITMMDGNFFSIYPYKNDLYTVTDVVETVFKKTKNVKNLKKYKKEINKSLIENKKNKIENKIKKYLPDFTNNFQYFDYIISIKSKIKNQTSSRYPMIKKDKNIINCFSGKIQGIYEIEKYIINEITNRQ